VSLICINQNTAIAQESGEYHEPMDCHAFSLADDEIEIYRALITDQGFSINDALYAVTNFNDSESLRFVFHALEQYGVYDERSLSHHFNSCPGYISGISFSSVEEVLHLISIGVSLHGHFGC
jgi:hypothetical protein